MEMFDFRDYLKIPFWGYSVKRNLGYLENMSGILFEDGMKLCSIIL